MVALWSIKKESKCCILRYLNMYTVCYSQIYCHIIIWKYLETDGFKSNPYDLYTDNKITWGETLPVVLNVDDIKSSHKDKNLVESFEQWIGLMYGYPWIGKVNSIRGNVHTCLFMNLDHTAWGELDTLYILLLLLLLLLFKLYYIYIYINKVS